MPQREHAEVIDGALFAFETFLDPADRSLGGKLA